MKRRNSCNSKHTNLFEVASVSPVGGSCTTCVQCKALDNHSAKRKPHTECRVLAEAEGFEPPWACTQTVFKTASL